MDFMDLSKLLDLPELTGIPQRPNLLLTRNLNWDEMSYEIEYITSNILGFLNNLTQKIVVFYVPPKKELEDSFDWFVSSEIDLSDFRGKYIAVYGKQIVSSGATAIEAYNKAKALNPESEPALTYIPESEDEILCLYVSLFICAVAS